MSEWQGLMVLAPEQPNVYLLNPSSGVVLELCDGRSEQEVRQRFAELVADTMSTTDADRLVGESLALLEQRGLVDRFD